MLSEKIKITKIQREEQRNNRKVNAIKKYATPPKSVLRKCMLFKVDEKAEKYGYDFEPNQCRTLKYMQ